MVRKSLAVGIIFMIISLAALVMLVSNSSIFQLINPIAALSAITTAILGLVWFKKTSK